MPTRSEDYSVGWICALATEFVVACELLDEEYTGYEAPRVNTSDDNSYCFGRIHEHNVVISCLPKGRYGTTSAAIVASNMRSSFPDLRFSLLVGIAGGAPSQKHDIRLGDVIVSSPTPRFGGLLQYDFGKAVQCHEFEEIAHSNSPPAVLLKALSIIEAQHERKGHRISETIADMLKTNGRLVRKYSRPNQRHDKLYQSLYLHSEHEICDCQSFGEAATAKDALGKAVGSRKKYNENSNEIDQISVPRRERDADEDDPAIHYGLIASANTLMKDATARDALIRKYDVLCFEMEAAGLVHDFPCIVIRGICDYSDTHKNDVWQGYAAAVAAAYAKELLQIIPGRGVNDMTSVKYSNTQCKELELCAWTITDLWADESEEYVQMSSKLVKDIRSTTHIETPLPRQTHKIFLISIDVGVNNKSRSEESCVSTNYSETLFRGGYDMLYQRCTARFSPRSSYLGRDFQDALPVTPNKSWETRWRLYIYCSPCTTHNDLAIAICGKMSRLNGVIRVDDRLLHRSAQPSGILALQDMEHTLANIKERAADRDYLSSFYDHRWIEKRLLMQEEKGAGPSHLTLDDLLKQSQYDERTSALCIIAETSAIQLLLANTKFNNMIEISDGVVYEICPETDERQSSIEFFCRL